MAPHADFCYPPNTIQLKNINFSLEPEDRIGILGANGAGKSTLMKLLSGILKPTTGNLFASKDLKIGYFAQHQVDQLNLNESAIAHLQQLGRAATEQELRNYLGGFDFKDKMIFGPVATFSGGEKARLALAMIVWQKPNLLLLDEPTNHLDLDMREALAYALQDYAGALVLVSHDRSLLKAAVDDFYLVGNNEVTKFSGDLRDYEKWLLDSKKDEEIEPKKENKNKPIAIKSNEKKLQQLENKITKLYSEKDQLEKTLADPCIYQKENQVKLQEFVKKLNAVKNDIQIAEAAWDELAV